jgi:outer membrane protein OmpA-like peptidoglycan-associated protein
MINNTPLVNTRITVKQGTIITQALDTRGKSDFRVSLDFGKNYRIYFSHPQVPLMFMEVIADNVPVDKYEYRMTYELNVPLVDKSDEDIDTTVFKRAFHRVVFNGKSKMVDDSAYNNRFARTILKKEEPVKVQVKKEDPPPPPPQQLPSIVAGKVWLSGQSKLPLANKQIALIGHNGSALRTTYTNKSGAFVFTNVRISEAQKIRMYIREVESGGNLLSLVNGESQVIAESRAAAGMCEWPMAQDKMFRMVDNQYSSNIGGKLVSASPKQKRFFSNKTVYLSNRMNTVVQQTKTTELGTFVFEDIKPDHQYLIGVDKAELGPGERIDLLSKDDRFVGSLDSVAGNRNSLKMNATYNQVFNEVSLDDKDIKMDVKGTIFGDNVNNPIGKLKIMLLNDQYEVIDSAITSDYGSFKFKYLPFLKRFYLSAENNNSVLDVFKDILIYSSDKNLIKVMTHHKGKKFKYQPIATEINSLRDIEIADPWLELLQPAPKSLTASAGNSPVLAPKKAIAENILFETARYDVSEESKEILDKIILVLSASKALRIEIGAHTDSKGSDVSNIKLSEMRAKTVRDYIVNAGIEGSRITSRGFGESRLLNGCKDNVPCTEIEHAQNRRIEFRILGQEEK